MEDAGGAGGKAGADGQFIGPWGQICSADGNRLLRPV
jgi:hypothetical protein